MEIEDEKSDQQLVGLDSLLEILGNPTRRNILSKLAKVPHTGPEIADDLGISRQAIHSQLKLLTDSGLVEGPPEGSRGGTYLIRSNISVRIDITPQYYNIKFNTKTAFNDSNAIEFQDMNCSINYSKIKTVDDKVKFLGDQILKVEHDISNLDQERRDFLIRKQCILQEIRKLMRGQYKDNLEKRLKIRYDSIKDKSLNDLFNLSEEIVFTMFYNPQRYKNRVDINKLLDDLFFSDMDSYQRDQRFGSIRSLLTDMSSLMGFLREDDEDWFFNFVEIEGAKKSNNMKLHDLKKEMPDIFERVKKDVEKVFGRHRVGLSLGLAEMGMFQGGFIGGMHFAPGTDIIMNISPLRIILDTQPYEIIWAYTYHILLHEYIHSLGILDEHQCRMLTLKLTKEIFKESDHPAIILAESGIGTFIPNLKLRYIPPNKKPDGIVIQYLSEFEKESFDYYS